MTALLVSPGELGAAEVAVEGEPYRHLFRAARLAVGDPLRVVDGAGRAREGRVIDVDRKRGRVALGEELPSLEPTLALELLVASPRPQRASWLVEKATELGVVAVRFLTTERSVRELGAGQRGHLEKVARSAVEQCGRARCPEISGPHAWAELPRLLGGFESRLHLDFGHPPPIPGPGPRLALLVGPEGGWTEAERRALLELGNRPAGLGERALRVETAALAAASICLLRR
ncbi:MAG TPA: RsmE family RNA methyltransferase [Thermoanaerobaculia bacterium]|nr:RsmE family RNA methyltransferase [Thermoanaerobaculia bacterium]